MTGYRLYLLQKLTLTEKQYLDNFLFTLSPKYDVRGKEGTTLK